MKRFVAAFGLFLIAIWFVPECTMAAYPEYSGPVQLHKLRGLTVYARSIDECDIVDAHNLGANTLTLLIMADDLFDYKGRLKMPIARVNKAKLAKIRWAVDRTNQLGMYAIVSVHESPGHVKYSCNWQERDNRMWDKKKGRAFQRMYVTAIKALAKEFAFHPATCVGFKVGNELDPWYVDECGAVKLDESRGAENTALQIQLHRAIRDEEKRARFRDRTSRTFWYGVKHLIVVEAPFNYRMSSLITWTPPECFFDGFTALGIHFYEPLDFTHQDDAWWDRSITPKAYQGWFAESWGDGNFQPAWWDEHKIRQRLFLTAAEYQKVYGKVLPLLCTEFGAMKLAWGSENYLWDTICIFKELWIGWTAHSWREYKWLDAIGRHGEESMWDFEGHAGRLGAIWAGFRNLEQ